MKSVQELFLPGTPAVETPCDLILFPSDGVPKQGQVAVVSTIINCYSLSIRQLQLL